MPAPLDPTAYARRAASLLLRPRSTCPECPVDDGDVRHPALCPHRDSDAHGAYVTPAQAQDALERAYRDGMKAATADVPPSPPDGAYTLIAEAPRAGRSDLRAEFRGVDDTTARHVATMLVEMHGTDGRTAVLARGPRGGDPARRWELRTGFWVAAELLRDAPALDEPTT